MTSAFQINLWSKNLGMILMELLLQGSEDGKRWRSLEPAGNRYEVWLGNELVATMPCLRGGMGSDCTGDSLKPTIAYDVDFTTYTAAESPLASPFVIPSGAGGRALEVADVPSGGAETFFCRSTYADSSTGGSAVDGRSYACDQSAKTTVGVPDTTSSVVRAAGHGVMVRAKILNADQPFGGQSDGDGTYGYFFNADDPTSIRFESRLSMATEVASDAGPPPDATYLQNVLARSVLDGQLLLAGTTLTLTATGSSISGVCSSTSGDPDGFTLSSTNTRARWGHPGFYGTGRNGVDWPNINSMGYFTTFNATGRLDPSDSEFLDP